MDSNNHNDMWLLLDDNGITLYSGNLRDVLEEGEMRGGIIHYDGRRGIILRRMK